MRIRQALWKDGHWTEPLSAIGGLDPDLVLVFGGRVQLADPGRTAEIRSAFPSAHVLGCSTAGEIKGPQVFDGTLCVTAVAFEHTTLRGACTLIDKPSDSYEVGLRLVSGLPADDLAHVFVISNGLQVNGSELIKGMVDGLPEGVTVTGGLSADGALFESTLVMSDCEARSNRIAAVGLYGDRIQVGYGSLGGWDSFGPQRLVTRSEGNVLYELDGKPALDLYKSYLGEHADGLPATGLLFPLSVDIPGARGELVRTILGMDEDRGSMTFAGDVPEGSIARLMKANSDRLIEGAAGAAIRTVESLPGQEAELAILISCVGRKLVLKQRIEEEVEAVQEVLGENTTMAGFYSYGEISPVVHAAPCELHNQTMTITTLSEA